MAALKPEKLRQRVDRNVPTKKLGELGETFVWAPVLRGSLLVGPEELLTAFDLQKPKGVIFTGSCGNGRHTTAQALAATICNPKFPHPPHYLKLTGWELDCEDAAEAEALIDCAMEFAENGNALCLLLDSPEESRHSRQVQQYLAEQLERDDLCLMLILITRESDMVFPPLLREMKRYHCAAPTCAQREAWFAKKLFEPTCVPIENMTHVDLAKRTEGFSWKQLNDLLDSMRQYLAMEHFTKYKQSGGSKEKLKLTLERGGIVLPGDVAEALVHSVESQNPPPQMAAPVQIMTVGAAQQTVAQPVQQAGEAPAGSVGFDVDKAREEANRLKHPEKLSVEDKLAAIGL